MACKQGRDDITLKGSDVLGTAKTGAGKTLAFLLTLTACDRVSFYILHGFLWVVRYMTTCTCITLIVNLPTE